MPRATCGFAGLVLLVLWAARPWRKTGKRARKTGEFERMMNKYKRERVFGSR
ncbi:hypothetical protein HFP15_27920 [Amycolatopsis sp. K13G38]|uniref:Uncharacterized protein n=1 Tax=Amycolatopsis acididurans TaxID=2724524 RepID=A0ABX1JEN8_9PSEU|nr:hypothetical protein [Amycolatopsis acididurans]NKQ56707.1 hypothetical protein [Amycolatopsis acididurans]